MSTETNPEIETTMAEEAVAEDNSQEIAELVTSLEKERHRAAELKDSAERMQADLSFYQKKSEQEREEARQEGASPTLKRILGLMDDIERAFKEEPPHLMGLTWANQLTLVHSQLVRILTSFKVEPIDALNQPFDPNLHEAVGMKEDDLPGDAATVEYCCEEYLRGYKIGGKVLRASIVRIERRAVK